jgi:hypothetical protein
MGTNKVEGCLSTTGIPRKPLRRMLTFERYVLQLAMEVEKVVKIPVDQTVGKGIARWLAYLRRAGVVNTSCVPLWPQVDAAFKIRNCLMHAQGFLRLSKKGDAEIRRIVKSGTFLEPQHRKKRQRPFEEIKIVKSRIGDRLEITNEYSYLVAVYLRDYFGNLRDQLQFS